MQGVGDKLFIVIPLLVIGSRVKLESRSIHILVVVGYFSQG